jgi:ubiquinone/menaquinone biosynthesis C-methylase UbiE
MNVAWDYTALANSYDKRADYCPKSLDRLSAEAGVEAGSSVADIGAGTGKLAVPLARRGFRVSAVEPNAAMRALGLRNSRVLPIVWSEGTGEETGLVSGAFDLVTFGSSFNVVDQFKALIEAGRLLKSFGTFACMWNHRDLDDPLQARIEAMICDEIPGYLYGKRREDPRAVIDASGTFGPTQAIEDKFIVEVSTADFVEAWRSHGTLQRQAGEKFLSIVERIERMLRERETISVPYFTRVWHAKTRKASK